MKAKPAVVIRPLVCGKCGSEHQVRRVVESGYVLG